MSLHPISVVQGILQLGLEVADLVSFIFLPKLVPLKIRDLENMKEKVTVGLIVQGAKT